MSLITPMNCPDFAISIARSPFVAQATEYPLHSNAVRT